MQGSRPLFQTRNHASNAFPELGKMLGKDGDRRAFVDRCVTSPDKQNPARLGDERLEVSKRMRGHSDLAILGGKNAFVKRI
jgi:hypothetical protein